MFWLLPILCSFLCQGNCIKCPSIQTVERMGNATILCSGDTQITQCYWYLGSTTSTRPILKLVNNIKDGTKLHDEHYDLTDDCGMKIINAQISHEATYTYVAFFSDGRKWKQHVSVIVTVTPAQHCPQVPTCNTCDKCTVVSTENEVKRLTCSIDRTRPAVTLYWHHEGDITIVSNSSHSVPNYALNGTWHSSATIEYGLACQENATLRCVSQEPSISSIIIVVTSECYAVANPVDTSDSSPDNNPQERFPVILIVSTLTIAFVILIMFIIWMTWIRLWTPFNKHESIDDAAFKSMKNDLKDIYSHYLISESDNLYTSCQVNVCTANIVQYECSADKMLNTSFLSENKRAWFIGESGYGKTAFFLHLLQKWIKDEAMKNVILLYFPLNTLSNISNILEEIMLMLPEKLTYDVNMILRGKQSIVILDGLNYINQETSNKQKLHNVNDCKLNLEDLLQNDNSNFPYMNVWISSRRSECVKIKKDLFARVDFNGFDEEERDRFFSHAIDNYKKLHKSKMSKKAGTGENAPLISDNYLIPMTEEWNKLYPNTGENMTVCPLVARLFAFNFFRSSDAAVPITPNSTSSHEVLWDVENLQIDLSKVNWHLLVSLLESSTQVQSKELTINKIFGGKSLSFEKGKAGYQRNAVIRLCIMCRDFKVECESLTFYGDYPRSLHKYLPTVKDGLTLKNIMLAREDLIGLINRSSGRIKNVRFIDCQMPGSVSKGEFEGVEEGEYPKVIRMEKRKKYFFDSETLTWIEEARAQDYAENAEDVC